MPFAFVTEYPLWMSVFCVLLGLGLSYLLYNRQLRNEGRWQWRFVVMAICRFLGITLLSFLLLSPLIRYTNREVKKPVVALAIDNSASVVTGADSAYYRNEFPAKLDQLEKALDDRYEVHRYYFDHQLRDTGSLDFTGKQTNIANVFSNLTTDFDNQNLGAVILLSDGIYNQGNNPLYTTIGIKSPVYTVALGDTTVRKDVLISGVRFNQLAYLDNRFPLLIGVDARKCRGEQLQVQVTENGKVLYSAVVTAGTERFHTELSASLIAETPGTHHYIVSVSPLKQEISYVNNRKDIYIEVLDARQKIIILAEGPHPDIAAFKQAIEYNRNYEVVTVYTNAFSTALLKEADMVITLQMPVSQASLQILKQVDEANVPALHIIGSQTNLNLLNQWDRGLRIAGGRASSNEVYPIIEEDFSLFNMDPDQRQKLEALPPLLTPFGRYQVTAPYTLLARQQIGSVKTEMPLIFFMNTSLKKGFFCGEGFWKWRLNDYEKHQNHEVTNQLAGKMVQFLAARNDKRKFRVNLPKNTFQENERITLDAELYNASYELVNQPEVKLNISNSEGNSYPFNFSRTGNAYSLDAGLMPPGSYTYKAQVTYNNKIETTSGVFTVTPLQAELNETIADHRLLYSLASRNSGEMIYPAQLASLADKLKARDDIKPVIYLEKTMKDLVNLKWYAFFMVLCFTVEWVLRKKGRVILMRLIRNPVLCNYYLTYRCNASCSFCDIWEKPHLMLRLKM